MAGNPWEEDWGDTQSGGSTQTNASQNEPSILSTIGSNFRRMTENYEAAATQGTGLSDYAIRRAKNASNEYQTQRSQLGTVEGIVSDIGSYAPIVGLGMINPVAGAAGLAGATTAEALSEQQEAGQDYNMGTAQAAGAAAGAVDLATAGLGAAAPLIRRPLARGVAKIAANPISQGAVGAGSQTVSLNLAAGRPWDENLGESLAMGGITGGAMHYGARGIRRLGGARPEEGGVGGVTPEQPSGTPPEGLQASVDDFRNTTSQFDNVASQLDTDSPDVGNIYRQQAQYEAQNSTGAATNEYANVLDQIGMPHLSSLFDQSHGKGIADTSNPSNMLEGIGGSREEAVRERNLLHTVEPTASSGVQDILQGKTGTATLAEARTAYDKGVDLYRGNVADNIQRIDAIHSGLESGTLKTQVGELKSLLGKLQTATNSTLSGKNVHPDVAVDLQARIKTLAKQTGLSDQLVGLDGTPQSFSPITQLHSAQMFREGSRSVSQALPDTRFEPAKELKAGVTGDIISDTLSGAQHGGLQGAVGGFVKGAFNAGKDRFVTRKAQGKLAKAKAIAEQRRSTLTALKEGNAEGAADVAETELNRSGINTNDQFAPEPQATGETSPREAVLGTHMENVQRGRKPQSSADIHNMNVSKEAMDKLNDRVKKASTATKVSEDKIWELIHNEHGAKVEDLTAIKPEKLASDYAKTKVDENASNTANDLGKDENGNAKEVTPDEQLQNVVDYYLDPKNGFKYDRAELEDLMQKHKEAGSKAGAGYDPAKVIRSFERELESQRAPTKLSRETQVSNAKRHFNELGYDSAKVDSLFEKHIARADKTGTGEWKASTVANAVEKELETDKAAAKEAQRRRGEKMQKRGEQVAKTNAARRAAANSKETATENAKSFFTDSGLPRAEVDQLFTEHARKLNKANPESVAPERIADSVERALKARAKEAAKESAKAKEAARGNWDSVKTQMRDYVYALDDAEGYTQSQRDQLHQIWRTMTEHEAGDESIMTKAQVRRIIQRIKDKAQTFSRGNEEAGDAAVKKALKEAERKMEEEAEKAEGNTKKAGASAEQAAQGEKMNNTQNARSKKTQENAKQKAKSKTSGMDEETVRATMDKVIEDQIPTHIKSVNDPAYARLKGTLAGLDETLVQEHGSKASKMNAVLTAIDEAVQARENYPDFPELWIPTDTRFAVKKAANKKDGGLGSTYYGDLYQRLRGAVFGDERSTHMVRIPESRIIELRTRIDEGEGDAVRRELDRLGRGGE